MDQTKNRKPNQFILYVLLLQIAANISILFDIPFARQSIVFIYFTLIPGYIILKLLKMEFGMLETLLFSVGFSVAFLMIVGLLVNEIYLLAGISHPLSLMPLLLTLNVLTLVGIILFSLRNGNVKSSAFEISKFSFLVASLLSTIVILSLVGAVWVNVYRTNSILMAMIISISLLFVITVKFKNPSFQKLYPIIIITIALSLLYHGTLISRYPVSYGSDLARELFIFKNTLYRGHWEASNPYNGIRYGRVHSMLSVTILPTVYSVLLNLEPNWTFKILYPTIFSFAALGLYVLWKEKIGNKAAFISAFLFMANASFYTEIFGLNRQMIAEMFFVLLLFTVLNNKIKSRNRAACFTIFSVCLITSHYGIAEIFLFFIFLVLILLIIRKDSSAKINLNLCILFFVIMFSWYLYTASSSVFKSIVDYGDYVYRSLSDIFNLQAREPQVLRGLGLEAPPTIWNMMSRSFHYAIEFLIVLGFIGLLTKKEKTMTKLDKETFMLILVAMTFLGLIIVVPGLSKTMNMSRFFHILLFLIAPLTIIGVNFLVGVFKKNKEFFASILLIVVLVPYFLFQTGFVYEVVGNDTWCLPLSAYRMPAYRSRGFLGYIDGRDISGVYWLKANLDIRNIAIYADVSSANYVFFSYGMVPKERIMVLSNVTTITNNSILYLSRLNTIDNIIMGMNRVWNTTDFPLPDDLNKVYTDGACEIYIND